MIMFRIKIPFTLQTKIVIHTFVKLQKKHFQDLNLEAVSLEYFFLTILFFI